MSGLRPPALGPIVGHTTERSCRLWIQADDARDGPGGESSRHRTVGVIGLLSDDGKTVSRAWYFRLQREFDRTGTFVLGEDVALGQHRNDGLAPERQDKPIELRPDTRYVVRMGTLSLDDPSPDDEAISDVMLAARLPQIDNIKDMLLRLPAEQSEAAFRTFPRSDQPQDRLAFLLGSCRYPGLMWKVKEADQIFAPMATHLVRAEDGATDARFTLMVGDQIYADALNRHIPIRLADTYEEFQERYRTALGSANMRRLLRQSPAYMILDDHEIEDNWTQDRIRDSGKHRLFNLAIGAYMSYQWSHGPRSYGRLLYYKFVCAGYPFFVLDTRTQRYKDDVAGLQDNHLLGRPAIDPRHRGQLQIFLDWLSEQQTRHGNVPKFVGSASVFAPNDMGERIDQRVATRDKALFESNAERRGDSDSWPAYPQTRAAILSHIVRHGIQNVVFLTGDIHCSNIARLEFARGSDDLGIFAYDITSSALYWPFPFADGDPNNYVHDSRKAQQFDGFPIDKETILHYRAWGFTQEDNFCRIDLDRSSHSLLVCYYDRKGRALDVGDEEGGALAADGSAPANRLALAPW